MKTKKLNLAASELTAAALLPCTFITILVWVLHGTSDLQLASIKFDPETAVIYWLILTALGIVVATHRNYLINRDPPRRVFQFRQITRGQLLKLVAGCAAVVVAFVFFTHHKVFLWFWIWLALLTLLGTAYRNNVLTPLRINRGLPPEGLGPWQAVRVVIYWGASLGAYHLIKTYVVNSDLCVERTCYLSVFGSDELVPINTGIRPHPTLSYVLGAILIALAFLLRFRETWARLWAARRPASQPATSPAAT